MADTLKLISAIARADVYFRLRRNSTIVILLAVTAGMYLLIPDYRSGNTLIQVEGSRVINNSTAIALGTAMMVGLLLSVIGYYLISNSIKRDILSRVGYIVASTQVKNGQYIVGKVLGNTLYLTLIMLACMVSAMIMFFVRGEGAFEPFTFLSIYIWSIMPAILFCSAVAICFEAIPQLSGRLGDVAFFFLWAAFLAIPVSILEQNGDARWLQGIDMIGIVQIIHQMNDQFHTSSMSIGFSEYDISKPPIVMTGINWLFSDMMLRIATIIVPVFFMFVGWLFFHRFNPTKIKFSVQHSKNTIFTKFNSIVKPITRVLRIASNASGKSSSLLGVVHADVLTTLALSPFVIIAMIVFNFISLVTSAEALRGGVLPAIFVVLIIALSDIVTRDSSAGMMNLLFTAPKIKKNYILWKCISAFVITVCFTLIPMMKLAFTFPVSAVSLFIGSILITAGAVGLGILTRSRKAYMGMFLMLLYISLNAAGDPPLDFAGFYGVATPLVQLVYASIAGVLIFSALIKYNRSLQN